MIILEVLTVLVAATILGWSAASHRIPRGILEWVFLVAGAVVLVDWMKGVF